MPFPTFNAAHRITLAAMLAYFVMSGMLAPIGILSAPMAEQFGQSVEEITAQFSFLTIGTLAGAIIALFIFERIELKNVMVVCFGLIAIALLTLGLHGAGLSLWLAIGLVGICCGVGLAGGALTITKIYSERWRASMLILTDSAFSLAGFATASLAVFFLARGFSWSSAYQVVGGVAVVIVLLAATAQFPKSKTVNDAASAPAENDQLTAPWPLQIWMTIGALFLYTLGQSSILLWLPNFGETALGFARSDAGGLVGSFWLGMFFGQLFSAWLAPILGVSRFIIFAAVTTFMVGGLLHVFTQSHVLSFVALTWGFANFALLKQAVALGSQLVSAPTGRLVSSLLLGATVGTSSAAWISSQIVRATHAQTAIAFGNFCHAIMAILVIAAALHYRRKVMPQTY